MSHEGNKADREGEILYNIPYMQNQKRNDTAELTKQKETHRLKRTNLWLSEGGMEGRDS